MKNINIKQYNFISTVLFFSSVMILPRSFTIIKLSFLVLFLITHFFDKLLKNKFTIYPRLILFYILIAIAGTFWSVIGLVNDGFIVGILDSVRLYVYWSIAFILIYTFLRSDEYLKSLHTAIVLSGILISLLNLFSLFDIYYQLGLIGVDLRKELDLNIGFHDGYIQITTHNIGSLFFIIPYLISLQFRSDSLKQNNYLTKMSLVLSLVLAVLSGRRALWLCIAFTPVIIIMLSYISGSMSCMKKRARAFIKLYIFTLVLSGSFIVFSSHISTDIGFINHLNAAFSDEDERTIQKGYLVDAFMNYPYFGSGFGGYADYVRSEKMPWLYELTYHQMLFNFGIIGIAYIIVLFLSYFYLIINIIKKYKLETVVPFCILVSILFLLIGAYSNPYLASFDFLIYIGLLPYLSTFKRGFVDPDRNKKQYIKYE